MAVVLPASAVPTVGAFGGAAGDREADHQLLDRHRHHADALVAAGGVLLERLHGLGRHVLGVLVEGADHAADGAVEQLVRVLLLDVMAQDFAVHERQRGGLRFRQSRQAAQAMRVHVNTVLEQLMAFEKQNPDFFGQ